ncbi:MAG: methyltransferase domain-containing protein [Lentisphaerae bacterium]|nr:methyltransferase domain-containing protein [Lentisphaerota bacterium]
MPLHPEDQKIRILTGEYCHVVPRGEIAELDMGCGAGSFTAALAAKYPDRRIIAADVMLGRLRKVVKKMERAKLENMDVLRVEARSLIAIMLPDASLDRVHILCPDPWPKNRHRGNRLLCSDFTTQLHRVLKTDGIFHFSSDDEYYSDAVNKVIAASGLFVSFPDGIADLAGVQSDFEKRWLAEGKMVHHRAWKKLPLPEVTIGH